MRSFFLAGGLLLSLGAATTLAQAAQATVILISLDHVAPPGSGHAGRQRDPAPEPATWAMMVGGFGAVGAAMRRQAGRRQRA